MGPAAPGEKQKLYFFRGGAGELVALTYVTAIPADFNGDRKVNAADLELFEICAAGPNVPLTPQCLSKDLDADQDADSSDFAVWQRCYSGNELALPTCND